MKKILSLCILVQGLTILPAAAEEVGVSTETAVSVSTAPAADIGMTESGKDVFITLTRDKFNRKDLPFNTQTAFPEAFKSYNAHNAGDAISRLTSISITPQWGLGSTRLAGIRGASSNQTLVLIDGRPMGGAGLSSSQDLAEIPEGQIDRVEIVRGGVSALYGPNAIGGVINVITKRATYEGKPVSNLGIEVGSFDALGYKLDFGSRYGPVDYFFHGNQKMISGFRDNTDARTHNLGGNFGFSMGRAGKLLVDLGEYHADAGVPGQMFPSIPPSRYNNNIEKAAGTPNARQETQSGYLRTSYILPLPADSLATLRLFGSEREVDFEDTEDFGFGISSVSANRQEQTKGGEAQFNLPAGFMVGGAFTRDKLDSDDFINPGNHYIARVENWGTFAQWNGKLGGFTLIPSVRYDQHSEAGDATNPRVQAIAEVTDQLKLSASAGKSFRAPTIDDLFTPFTDFGGGFSYVGNPDLKPEKGWTYDAGFETGSPDLKFRAGYFRANISDLIQTTPDLAATTINVGTARRQGAEVELDQLLGERFSHGVNYTYLDNQGKPQGFTEFVVLRLSPRHTVNYLSTWKPLKGLTFNNTLRYISTRWEGNNETNTKMAPDLLWGLRLGYHIRQAELFFGVDNVTNHRYEERGGYPLPGTTFYGGMNLRLWG